MTHPCPSVTILVPWRGDDCAHALTSAMNQRGEAVEIVISCAHGAAPPRLHDPRARIEIAAPGADLLAAGFAAARGALCIIAEADWAPDEASARAALFPEPAAARLLILPRGGAACAAPVPRTCAGTRAAALLFRDGAPPPLSALCAPTAVWRAAGAAPGAGRWGAALLTLRAEAAGARAEAPFGPWRADQDPLQMSQDDGIDGARAALRLAAPLLTPRERLWAEMRCLGPSLLAGAPGDARRLGWRGLRAGGARRAALALLTGQRPAEASLPG